MLVSFHEDNINLIHMELFSQVFCKHSQILSIPMLCLLTESTDHITHLPSPHITNGIWHKISLSNGEKLGQI